MTILELDCIFYQVILIYFFKQDINIDDINAVLLMLIY